MIYVASMIAYMGATVLAYGGRQMEFFALLGATIIMQGMYYFRRYPGEDHNVG